MLDFAKILNNAETWSIDIYVQIYKQSILVLVDFAVLLIPKPDKVYIILTLRSDSSGIRRTIFRPLGYERVYLPLYKVADTPFHIQGDDLLWAVDEGFSISFMYLTRRAYSPNVNLITADDALCQKQASN